MKRFFSLLFVALMVFTMVVTMAACSNKKGDKDKPVLRVGMECAYAPYNWAQSDDSNGAIPIKDSNDYAYGYDVMIAKYLADKMGYEVEIYKIDWDSLPMASRPVLWIVLSRTVHNCRAP